MKIRLAVNDDLPAMMAVFQRAREFMISIGDPHQWDDGYPSEEQILSDMEQFHSFVAVDEMGKVRATFCFIVGIDPTYGVIDDGAWLEDESLYGTIHRIASDGSFNGFFHQVIEWASDRIDNLRIDTHKDNCVMLHLIEKEGFTRCGIIYVRNHMPRIAFQRMINQ